MLYPTLIVVLCYALLVTANMAQIGWALNARVADFQQSVAYPGGEPLHFPNNVSRSRFLYDISLDNADYIVIDDLWRE